MNTKNYLLFLCLFFLCFLNKTIIAQKFELKGQLTTTNGSNPISGANIHLTNTDLRTSTDIFGNFSIANIIPGHYLLEISSLGYEKHFENISVTGNLTINRALKNSTINLSEIIVNPDKSHSTNQTLSGIDKLLRPINSSQDLLRLVPGLFIAQHAGGGKAEQIFLRGFDSDHGTDFNISVDGMPVNMVSHAHGQGYADFHFVIPETVDRLKVYKGPYTSRFGDFATSGTGEYSTKNSINENDVKLEGGMFDTYRAVALINLLDKKHLLSKEKENIYVAGEYVFTNSYFNEKQNFNRSNLFGKYAGSLDKSNYLTISLSNFYANWDASGQIPQRAVDSKTIDRFGSIDPSEGGRTHRTNFNTILTSTTDNNATIKNQLYFVNYYFNLYSNFTFFLNDPVLGDEINQTDQRNIIGYNGSYQKDLAVFGKVLKTTTGIGTRNDFTHISLKHAEKRNILDTIVAGEVYQQNSNSFTDLSYQLTNRFTINPGLRLDYFKFNFSDDRFDSLSGNKSILRFSPKLNFFYSPNDDLQYFIKSGIGFHSNDARSVVVNKVDNSLPKAYGAEIGSEFKIGKGLFVNCAIWGLYLESELVYIGDEGTVETNNPTRRIGTDLSIRYQINYKLFLDMDLNYNYGRLTGLPQGENYIPLAPQFTSTGGLTFKQEKGINAALRYRFIDSRPANETNSVVAKGSFLFDAVCTYKLQKIEFGLTAENLLNSLWNQSQFDTKSRLFNEANPVSELHFTPGTPFFLKGTISYQF